MKAALENEKQTQHGSDDILHADSPTLLVRGLVHSSNKSSGSGPESDVTATLAVMVRLQAPPQALVCVADPTQEARLAEAFEEGALFDANIIADEENAYAAMRAQLRKLVITDSLQFVRQLRALDFRDYVHILFVGSSSSETAALERGADDCISPQTSNAALVARLRGFRRICDLEVALHSALVQNQQLSTTDELTGLANRHFFTSHWPRELERAARNKSAIAVAMCDIDHFKLINDTHGHATGDHVLREFSVRLQQSLRREEKDWVARLGGEEFAIVLSGVSAAQAINIVEGNSREYPLAAFCFAHD
jgi:PleD family two-component response regulator